MDDQIVRTLKTDPARFEVVKNALTSAAEEMKIVLAKTAYSPLLKVAGDYSCGIFDVAGNMVAQGPDLPIHLGSMPDAVRAVVRAFPDVAPGDVFIHNDPYQGGSHLPDVNVVAPAYFGDRLLGLWLRAGALAGYRQRHARQLRRRDGDLWRGPAPAAGAAVSRGQAGPGHRGDHLRQCPHARRASGRFARPGGGEPAGGGEAGGAGRRNMAPTCCWASWRRCRITPKR